MRTAAHSRAGTVRRRRAVTGLGLLFTLAAGLVALPAAAQGAARQRLEAMPGYVDAERLGIYDREERLRLEVNLQGALIRFLAEALKGSAEEDELAEALGRIESIRFEMYELEDGELTGVKRRAAAKAGELAGGGWQRVVRVREEEAQTDLFLRMDGERIIGLVALFVDDEDHFGFINIVGEIDPGQIGRIGRQYNIDMLEEVQGELDRDQRRP